MHILFFKRLAKQNIYKTNSFKYSKAVYLLTSIYLRRNLTNDNAMSSKKIQYLVYYVQIDSICCVIKI
jgi:hypothetical protein